MNFEILTDLIMIMLQRKFPIGVKRNMDYTEFVIEKLSFMKYIILH